MSQKKKNTTKNKNRLSLSFRFGAWETLKKKRKPNKKNQQTRRNGRRMEPESLTRGPPVSTASISVGADGIYRLSGDSKTRPIARPKPKKWKSKPLEIERNDVISRGEHSSKSSKTR